MNRLGRLFVVATFPSTIVSGAELDFNRDVRPILSDNCFFCHGFDEHERKADLRLDTAEGAAAVVLSKGGVESEFIYRILTDDKDDLMPPEDSHKTLSSEEIAILKQWVAEGAEYDEPWAYVQPEKADSPAVRDAQWPSNWVDFYILSRLESAGLSPSPDADLVTLVRRLHFDLIGLPPEPERIDEFVDAVETNGFDLAWAGLVDELLRSPHFGERMAIYWLDLVRFADTVGYHGDQVQHISPYRDYVINSFNRNLPFDQFTREQLAGDLLDNPTLNQKVATGYNRLLQTSHEDGIQEKEYNTIYAADRVRNVSAVWMGATVGCAQCHDHKYDPYSIRDHYAMAAFFADIHDSGFAGDSNPTKRPPEIVVYSEEQQKRLAEIQILLEKLARFDGLKRDAKRLSAGIEKAGSKEKARLQALQDEISEIVGFAGKAPQELLKSLPEEQKQIEKAAPLTMITVAKEPRATRILPRGDWQDDTGEVVLPAVPAFLPQISNNDSERATRLDLANWLCDPQDGVGGLTARVMANRFWYLYFGTGISRSLSDFGGQGEPPANGALLDALAVEFHQSGWDTKSIVRSLVTSRAYRQSSVASPEMLERDPHNQLVDRQSRYRLPAEIIRDTALATSGLLVRDIGGPSVRPYQPAGYYRHLNFPTREYASDRDSQQWRRGVYVHWQRQFLHPMLKAMDAPSREECTAERPRSNTPTAALTLLNDPTFLEAARAFATRIVDEKQGGKTDAERLDFAFRQTLGRLPDPTEKQILSQLLAEAKSEFDADPKSAREFQSIGLASTPKTDDAAMTLAAWTTIARAMFNLSETITRN